jgi:1-pyrroline-5-carboxylate dehydrogenase
MSHHTTINIVGTYHLAEKSHVEKAIANALESRTAWANMAWEQRAAIFLKAAELLHHTELESMLQQ